MTEVVEWVGFVLGLAIVATTFSSVVGTIGLPRGGRSVISFAVWRLIHRSFMAAAGRVRRTESRELLLGLDAPLSLLVLLAAWLVLLLLGFALILLPLSGDDFPTALRLSGESLVTLGVTGP